MNAPYRAGSGARRSGPTIPQVRRFRARGAPNVAEVDRRVKIEQSEHAVAADVHVLAHQIAVHHTRSQKRLPHAVDLLVH